MRMERLESLIRAFLYLIVFLVFLWLAHSVDAQDMNREARYQRWLLISLEMSDVNEATEEWNTAVKRYKTLDDINSYELLYSLRKAQAANAKIEEHLMALDVPIGVTAPAFSKEFTCKCGKVVITNDPFATLCNDCKRKEGSP
jgi:uncharacterized protein YlxW (UPF0749 family)